MIYIFYNFLQLYRNFLKIIKFFYYEIHTYIGKYINCSQSHKITIDLFCKQEIALRDNKRVSNRAQVIEELNSGNGGTLPRDASNRESELFDSWHMRIFI